ncbi:MAG TPA: hypothetical protein VFP99_08130 [Chthoniobacterales bacterium]|nr:hypothetical protein [Chthoniobacterales bacterium]
MKPNTRITILGAMFCAAILTFATIANAGVERLQSKEIAPVPVSSCEAYDWSGFYLGVNLGGELGDYQTGHYFTDTTFTRTIENNQIFSDPTDSDTFVAYTAAFTFFNPGQDAERNSSFLGGGQVGFQKQWGRFVVGLEGDFDAAGSKGSSSFTSSQSDVLEDFENEFSTGGGEIEQSRRVTGNTALTSQRRVQENWMASVRLRAGYACGRCLFYVTGGGAFADVKMTATDTATTNFTVRETETFTPSETGTFTSSALNFVEGPFTETNVSKSSDTLVGWTAGGGVAWAATDCINLGLEYRHTDLGDNTFHFRSHNSAIFPGETNVDFQSDMVTVRLNFMLGHVGH